MQLCSIFSSLQTSGCQHHQPQFLLASVSLAASYAYRSESLDLNLRQKISVSRPQYLPDRSVTLDRNLCHLLSVSGPQFQSLDPHLWSAIPASCSVSEDRKPCQQLCVSEPQSLSVDLYLWAAICQQLYVCESQSLESLFSISPKPPNAYKVEGVYSLHYLLQK